MPSSEEEARPCPCAILTVSSSTSCLRKEPGAWNDFADRYMGLIYHVIHHVAHARSVVLSAADIEDIAAEVFLGLVEDNYAVLHRFRGASSLPTYLTVVTRRICVKEVIKRHREAELGHLRGARTARSSTRRLRWAQGRGMIASAEEVDRMLKDLPDREAEVVRLYHLKYLNYRQIGKQIGIPENSVGPDPVEERTTTHATRRLLQQRERADHRSREPTRKRRHGRAPASRRTLCYAGPGARGPCQLATPAGVLGPLLLIGIEGNLALIDLLRRPLLGRSGGANSSSGSPLRSVPAGLGDGAAPSPATRRVFALESGSGSWSRTGHRGGTSIRVGSRSRTPVEPGRDASRAPRVELGVSGEVLARVAPAELLARRTGPSDATP